MTPSDTTAPKGEDEREEQHPSERTTGGTRRDKGRGAEDNDALLVFRSGFGRDTFLRFGWSSKSSESSALLSS